MSIFMVSVAGTVERTFFVTAKTQELAESHAMLEFNSQLDATDVEILDTEGAG